MCEIRTINHALPIRQHLASRFNIASFDFELIQFATSSLPPRYHSFAASYSMLHGFIICDKVDFL